MNISLLNGLKHLLQRQITLQPACATIEYIECNAVLWYLFSNTISFLDTTVMLWKSVALILLPAQIVSAQSLTDEATSEVCQTFEKEAELNLTIAAQYGAPCIEVNSKEIRICAENSAQVKEFKLSILTLTNLQSSPEVEQEGQDCVRASVVTRTRDHVSDPFRGYRCSPGLLRSVLVVKFCGQ